MTVVPPPVIESEMADWLLLGGGNSGIVGDANHTYGFHCSAEDISSDDYSRWRDPNGADGPFVDWRYASAGDFSHKNDPALRAKHADVLARLMDGEMPMICEFIGKPWADQPVLYWARWNGIDTLQKYTGTGHDTWSHISWYRSRVNERANLWTGGDDMTPEERLALAQETAAEVWKLQWHSDDFPNPYSFPMGYMIFAVNAWLSEPPLRDTLAALQEQVKTLQEAVDKLSPGTGGLPAHKHEPGEVMPV